MKIFKLGLGLAFPLVALCIFTAVDATPVAIEQQRIIIDTDLGGCVDDIFAIDLAARMHRAGKLNLMAVMMNRPDRSDPDKKGEFLKFADRYLASLGLGDLPIGTSTPLAEGRQSRVFTPYWTLIHSNSLTGVGALLPTNRADEVLGALTNAVTLYRRLLADAPDHSVVICSIGFLNNLKALMESGANEAGDGIAQTGMELIAAKVKELRVMGGCFDGTATYDDKNGVEYNVGGDPRAAKKVFESWPSPIVCTPWEIGVKLVYNPRWADTDFPTGTLNPVIRATYLIWQQRGGFSLDGLWDPMTVLPLVDGDAVAPLSAKGGIAVDGEGHTVFAEEPPGNRRYQIGEGFPSSAAMDRLRRIFRETEGEAK